MSENTTIEGPVTALEYKTAKNGAQYICATVGGKKYNCFNQFASAIKELQGKWARVELEQSGQYQNVKMITEGKQPAGYVPGPSNEPEITKLIHVGGLKGADLATFYNDFNGVKGKIISTQTHLIPGTSPPVYEGFIYYKPIAQEQAKVV